MILCKYKTDIQSWRYCVSIKQIYGVDDTVSLIKISSTNMAIKNHIKVTVCSKYTQMTLANKIQTFIEYRYFTNVASESIIDQMLQKVFGYFEKTHKKTEHKNLNTWKPTNNAHIVAHVNNFRLYVKIAIFNMFVT